MLLSRERASCGFYLLPIGGRSLTAALGRPFPAAHPMSKVEMHPNVRTVIRMSPPVTKKDG
jgi:hypothetical protein